MGTRIVRSALLIHLLCTWYPFRWVIRLLTASKFDTVDGHAVCVKSVLQVCQTDEMELLVQFAQDFLMFNGYFLYVAIVTPSTYAVNRICLTYASSTLVLLVVSHNYFHPTPTVQEYTPTFLKESIICYSMGILILVLIPGKPVFQNSTTRKQSMKWSIPANAIFCGAVFELFIAFGAMQWNDYRDTVASYLCIWSVVVRAILLLRVRYFLHLPALRWMCAMECFYQLMVRPNLLSIVIRQDLLISPKGTMAGTFRYCTAITYGLGIWWAGGAKAFGAILSSEKED